MGRKKLYREVPLYTRIKKENGKFLDMVCEKTNMSKTEWMDLHLDYCRDNIGINKTAKLVSETRKQIPA